MIPLKDLMDERSEVIESLEKLNNADNAYIQKGLDILELTQNAWSIFSSPDDDVDAQRKLLNDIFSNIGLNGESLLCVYRKEAAIVLDKVEKTKALETKFEHDDNGLIKQKDAFMAASRPIWLGR